MTSEAIIKNARNSRSTFSINKDILLVAILPTDFVFGFGRLWQAYADDANERTLIVRSKEEADMWLSKRLKST